MNPIVSVIIPLHNKAPYIKRAIDSVLAQTIQKFEIIVINDGSTDNWEESVKNYTDQRIRYISQENKGVAAARNHGIECAKSELVAFLDADDEWLPEFLETVLRLRERYPEAGIYGTRWYIYYSEKKIKKQKTLVEGEGLIVSPFRYLIETGDFPVSASTAMIPKSVIQEIGLFKVGIPYAEDHEYWARIALYYPFAYSSTPLAIYYKNIPYSATQRYGLCEYHPFQDTLNNLPEENLSNHHLKSDINLYVEYWYFGWALDAMSRGHRKKALQLIENISSPKFRLKKSIHILFILLPQYIQNVIKYIRR